MCTCGSPCPCEQGHFWQENVEVHQKTVEVEHNHSTRQPCSQRANDYGVELEKCLGPSCPRGLPTARVTPAGNPSGQLSPPATAPPTASPPPHRFSSTSPRPKRPTGSPRGSKDGGGGAFFPLFLSSGGFFPIYDKLGQVSSVRCS